MSQYTTGTVIVTNGSATVTGSGTLWATNLEAGNLFIRQGDNVTYTIASVDNDTTLQLTAPYAGVTGSGVSYVGHRDFTPEGFPLMQDGDVETVVIYNYAVTLMSGYGSVGTEDNAGVVRLATQALAEAGTNDTRVMTPLKTTQHLTERTQSSPTDTTAGALMPVGAFGLGAELPALPSADANALVFTSYFQTSGSWVGSVYGGTQAKNQGYLLHIQYPTAGYAKQVWSDVLDSGSTFIRYQRAGVWDSDWQEVYHTGNLNTNEFGGSAGDIMATGFVRTASSTVQVFMPINKYTVPTSITVTGTFSVRAADGSTDLATGVVPTISPLTSTKILVLDFAVAAGLVGDSITIRFESSSSKITVNY